MILGQDEKPPLDELMHFGVKGMHWGVRRDRASGASGHTNRMAKKDAHEFARAKLFYGEGAGTRRKLIKAKVEGRTKSIPNYKKAFDHHLANQDLSKHASKAQSERARKNTVKSTAKTARGVRHILNGNSQYASLAAAMLVGGAMYAHKSGVDKVIFNGGKTLLRNIQLQASGSARNDFLRNLGVNI